MRTQRIEPVTTELKLFKPAPPLGDRLAAALERGAELEAQLATALRQYGDEVELKLVATIEVRDLRKRVRTALQYVRDETNDVAFEALLQHVEEALDD